VESVVSFAPHAQQPLSSAQPAPDSDELPTASLNVATGHASQAPASSRKPAWQRHEPAAESVAGCEFAGQATHAEAVVTPVAAEYVPALQSRHVAAADAPNVAEYLPVAQSVQSALPAVTEYLPATHATQELSVVAPGVIRYLPASQSVQVLVPVIALYLPATHAEHVPPSGPENPALHMQSEIALDPATD
jgi:hypothetical protein